MMRKSFVRWLWDPQPQIEEWQEDVRHTGELLLVLSGVVFVVLGSALHVAFFIFAAPIIYWTFRKWEVF